MKLLDLILLLALLATIGVYAAKADRLVNISLVVVEHPTSAPVADQIRLFEEGISRLSEVKVKPRVIKIEIVPDFYNVNGLEHLMSRLYTWAQYGKKQRFKGVVFYALPPMLGASGTQYAAGHAGAICIFTRNKNKKYAEGVLRVKSGSGYDREPQSRIIAFHEMLHLLGANHAGDNGFTKQQKPNVMHPNAQAYAIIPNLPILNITHRQVRWCKQGKNVLGKKL
jgi:hypothetical protein